MTHKKNSHVDNELIESQFELEAQKIARKLTRHKQQIALRRSMMLQAIVHGITSTYDLARTLHVSQSTCYRDVSWLKKQAAEELKTHISERVPWQYKVSTEGISEVLKFAWSIILQDKSSNKTATLVLIMQCYRDLLEMATNASIVTSALQEVERMKDQILASINQKHGVSDGE